MSASRIPGVIAFLGLMFVCCACCSWAFRRCRASSPSSRCLPERCAIRPRRGGSELDVQRRSPALRASRVSSRSLASACDCSGPSRLVHTPRSAGARSSSRGGSRRVVPGLGRGRRPGRSTISTRPRVRCTSRKATCARCSQPSHDSAAEQAMRQRRARAISPTLVVSLVAIWLVLNQTWEPLDPARHRPGLVLAWASSRLRPLRATLRRFASPRRWL